jgi:hypothetical protein
MSVSNHLDSSRRNSNPQDPFDKWQFGLFRIVLFIIAVWAMLKFLNEHVPILDGLRWIIHRSGH